MANTPVEFRYFGSTTIADMDFDLVPADDSGKTSFDGGAAEITELTNGKGRYQVTYSGAGTGHYTGHLYVGGTHVQTFDYHLADTTDLHVPINVQSLIKQSAILAGTPLASVSDVGPTTTDFDTDLTETSDDHYNDAFILFYNGVLQGQSRRISDYDGTAKNITVAEAFTEAPANGDDFVILGRSE
jgi:hypothetical protein